MTVIEAFHWIQYATKLEKEILKDLNLTPAQIRTIGMALSRNTLLNPPAASKEKTGGFVCVICNQGFLDTYVTKHPTRCHRCRQ